jgi:SAM-dependent methyltransferase
MTDRGIKFDDGAAYEQMMGTWSRLAGSVFLEWLAPDTGLRWIDVGCGNGAFTQLLVDRCAPAEVHGVDPAEGQLAFARSRPCAVISKFSHGYAHALPFPDGGFDAAIMALALFYAPDPAQAVSEMVRVTKPGGSVSTYTWDILNGLSPTGIIQAEMKTMGIELLSLPSPEASRMDVLCNLWADVGLQRVRTRTITVARDFDGFEDFWATTLLQPNIGQPIRALTPDAQDRLKDRLRDRLQLSPDGRLRCLATANAITGHKPRL